MHVRAWAVAAQWSIRAAGLSAPRFHNTEATVIMSFNPSTIPGTAMILQKARPGHREDMK